jgi:exopolyphosphatase/guanosine-5'-triphosphate,3'-diphosphate pyrophosphatase
MNAEAREPVAALDIGTNTVLLLIAELDSDGALRVLEEQCRTPRLGEGLARSGRIAPATGSRPRACAPWERRLCAAPPTRRPSSKACGRVWVS